jgi:hypothetical protein
MVLISLVLPHDRFKKSASYWDQTLSLTPGPPSFSVINSPSNFLRGQKLRLHQTCVYLKRVMLSSIYCHYASLQRVMADVIEIGR